MVCVLFHVIFSNRTFLFRRTHVFNVSGVNSKRRNSVNAVSVTCHVHDQTNPLTRPFQLNCEKFWDVPTHACMRPDFFRSVPYIRCMEKSRPILLVNVLIRVDQFT